MHNRWNKKQSKFKKQLFQKSKLKKHLKYVKIKIRGSRQAKNIHYKSRSNFKLMKKDQVQLVAFKQNSYQGMIWIELAVEVAAR